MKISDITQRSQVQHIAEGRKQLDENLLGLGWKAALAAAQAAGIIGTGVDAAKNFSAWWDDKITAKELIARTGGDLALGLGLGGGVAAGKQAWKTGKNILGKGDNVRDLLRQQRIAQRDMRKELDRVNKLKGRTDISPANRRTRENKLAQDRKVAAANLKAANQQLSRSRGGTKTRDFLNWGATGLGATQMLGLGPTDTAYKALGGANKSGQPTAGTGMDGGNAGGGDGKTDAQRAAERALRYKSDYITKGITTVDP
jgi:hypothetical protein